MRRHYYPLLLFDCCSQCISGYQVTIFFKSAFDISRSTRKSTRNSANGSQFNANNKMHVKTHKRVGYRSDSI